MDSSEQRMIGALLLLLGFTLFTIGLYTGQFAVVLEIIKKVFTVSISGVI
jgi:hypothetical protein